MTQWTHPAGLRDAQAGAADAQPLAFVWSRAGQLVRQLSRLAQNAHTKTQLLESYARLFSDLVVFTALWYLERDEQGAFSGPQWLLDGDGQALEHLNESMRVLGEKAAADRTMRVAEVPLAPNHLAIAVPLENAAGKTEVLGGLYPKSQPPQPPADWTITVAAAYTQSWLLHRHLTATGIHAKSLTDFVNLTQALNETGDQPAAYLALVNHLRKLADATQVALVIIPPLRDEPRLEAISDVEHFDPTTDTNKIIASAAVQSLEENRVRVWPVGERDSADGALVFQQYCKTIGCEGCINLPLNTEGHFHGALLLGVSRRQAESDSFQKYVQQLVQLASGQLGVVLRANRHLGQLVRQSLCGAARNSMGQYVLGIAAVLVAAMFVRAPYRIGCDCEIQLVERRLVCAPYEGILEKTLVENGDVVQQDQVMALVDGRQQRIELSRLQAELDSQRKQRESALARGDIAQSQIAQLEGKRLQAEIDLLTSRLDELEIRSPICGAVVSGNLDKVVGAPLEMGQQLFEVGPLDEMLVEIGIDESEIQYVRPGMAVTVRLDAYPTRSWRGSIDRIHPRAEIIEDNNVYVAEVQLANFDGQLRPGMKGRAIVRSDWRALGWNLFHRAWEHVQAWMIW